MKIGVFATRDIATGDELWTKYSDVSTGTNGGRKLTQQSRLAVAVKKEAVKKEGVKKDPDEEMDEEVEDLTLTKVKKKVKQKKKAEKKPPFRISSEADQAAIMAD